MKNVYHIREGGGIVTESSLPDVAHLIHMGKLKFTGKKIKQSKGDLTTFRYYIRIDHEPFSKQDCTKPCCAYIVKG